MRQRINIKGVEYIVEEAARYTSLLVGHVVTTVTRASSRRQMPLDTRETRLYPHLASHQHSHVASTHDAISVLTTPSGARAHGVDRLAHHVLCERRLPGCGLHGRLGRALLPRHLALQGAPVMPEKTVTPVTDVWAELYKARPYRRVCRLQLTTTSRPPPSYVLPNPSAVTYVTSFPYVTSVTCLHTLRSAEPFPFPTPVPHRLVVASTGGHRHGQLRAHVPVPAAGGRVREARMRPRQVCVSLV